MLPGQRNDYTRTIHQYLGDFPKRLERFQRESGLSWAEIARRLGTYCNTLWLWKEGRSLPDYQHRKALWEFADSKGLGHLFRE